MHACVWLWPQAETGTDAFVQCSVCMFVTNPKTGAKTFMVRDVVFSEAAEEDLDAASR